MNLVIYGLQRAKSTRNAASAKVWEPAAVNTPAAAPRAPSPSRATARCAVSKAARCRCTAVLPKRGFTNIFHKEYAIINVGALENLEGDTFTPESLVGAGVVKKLQAGLKILGKRRTDPQDHRAGPSVLQIRAGQNREGRRHAPRLIPDRNRLGKREARRNEKQVRLLTAPVD